MRFARVADPGTRFTDPPSRSRFCPGELVRPDDRTFKQTIRNATVRTTAGGGTARSLSLRAKLGGETHAGLKIGHKTLPQSDQLSLLSSIVGILGDAPLFTPIMPRTGKPFSVKMTNCGQLGWVSDRDRGYRYQEQHPVTGQRWPAMPETLVAIWERFAGYGYPAEACLINVYGTDARMGLHRDLDEQALDAPVVSISLGDDCLFRVSGLNRSDPTQSFRLRSGAIVVLGGESRLAYHGVDRIYPGTSPLPGPLPAGARINLTLRRVRAPRS